MNTNQPFTERTAALTRLPQARILPKAALDLLADMAAALDKHQELHGIQEQFNHVATQKLKQL